MKPKKVSSYLNKNPTQLNSKQTASLPYPELLAYAQKLSTFSSAPPNLPPELMAPGGVGLNGPMPPLFFPPFPNEEKMRRGKLNQEKPLEMLGEMHDIGGAQGMCVHLSWKTKSYRS
jgi:mediator of RNA polymerase II transcription subunit 4